MKVVDARNSTAPVAETTAPITRSLFPVDAQAVIYKPARSTMMSAPKRKEEWKLQFERRTPLRIEPLMGWTEDDDPLAQVELSFPSAEAAIAYARRQGLQYIVLGSPAHDPQSRIVAHKDAVESPPIGDPPRRPRRHRGRSRFARCVPPCALRVPVHLHQRDRRRPLKPSHRMIRR